MISELDTLDAWRDMPPIDQERPLTELIYRRAMAAQFSRDHRRQVIQPRIVIKPDPDNLASRQDAGKGIVNLSTGQPCRLAKLGDVQRPSGQGRQDVGPTRQQFVGAGPHGYPPEAPARSSAAGGVRLILIGDSI